MKNQVTITAIASVSPLGVSPEEIWQNYLSTEHLFTEKEFDQGMAWAAFLSDREVQNLRQFRTQNPKYKNLDPSVLYALYASRKAVERAGWQAGETFGVNIGSSRGATSSLEKYHREFIENNYVATLTSPTTTLGNISSWVAHDLQSQGPEISHSITCSTALHALLNGVAWLNSGFTDKFLVGGSEAPLTSFTIGQMQALKIYASDSDGFPCRAMDMEKSSNSMVLGEGASVACLEAGVSANALAVIEGIGYATEPLEHSVSLSSDAVCFQKSMKMALGELSPDEVDAIVLHAPGTVKGDLAEKTAIEKVFSRKIPLLTTNKWKIGHTFGASGMLSIEMALLMLSRQIFFPLPYKGEKARKENLKRVLVNAVGFGGNAVSILLAHPMRD
ncbi:beta-ketoacyl synthase N-terminal-like domain-containing protein [Poritiphilus flavus]|uniref:Beta-ketoacyl synthase n=1 Tax=Poritiphilus flavus TaxID=2697053 RepID=A0A6L9ECY2_9FLAO|nr:beta-ketoacyl synthase N-terminal-like domain-containing protein [Poritiphilus flavus]NAS12610.1 beta-ketoacyl synthase [Poritiphilus flavus]